MAEVANIYDSGPISPIARIKDNIAVWTGNKYVPYKIQWMEGLPLSSPLTIDLVTAPATSIAANQQTAKGAVRALQMNANELLHLRWEPVDDVEGLLWELGEGARYSPFGGQLRVSLFTHERDPWLATTTFYILGNQKDAQLAAANPWPIAQPTARFNFWGYRYILAILGDEAFKGPITYLPAQAYLAG